MLLRTAVYFCVTLLLMLLVCCRSVAASYAQMHIHTAAPVPDAAAAAPADGAAAAAGGDSMAALEAAALVDKGTRLSGFVSAGVIQQGQQAPAAGQQAAAAAAGGSRVWDMFSVLPDPPTELMLWAKCRSRACMFWYLCLRISCLNAAAANA